MKRRMMGSAFLVGTGVLAGFVPGCGSDAREEPEYGTLKVPLATQGPSGAEYRLRDAVFEISQEYYCYDDCGYGGDGGAGTISVSSENDPSASSINVSLERGGYYVRLRSGWRMEKTEGGVTTDVEAVLLSSSPQWVYISPHTTRWLEYSFGIGDRELWFNGELNIDIRVYEDPDQYYGSGGDSSGWAGQSSSSGSPGWGGEGS